jgi:hypothetical protein
MCNCGNKRTSLSSQETMQPAGNRNTPAQGSKLSPVVNFKYTGKTALTIKGNITGKNYRFGAPEAIQGIDYRDAPYMVGVPVLEKLR